jgi:hypothetical protein
VLATEDSRETRAALEQWRRPRRSTAFNQEDAMGLFTKDIKTMEDLFLHGLQDIYYAEQQITKALPKLIEKATNRDLIGLQGASGGDE